MVSSLLLSTRSPSAVFFFFSLFLVGTTSFHGAGVSASSASFSAINATENKDEAEALLNWKSTLDNRSQSLLSSWHGNNPCLFTGVACNHHGAITHVNLSGLGLRGTLDGLDFSRLTSVVSFDLANNSIYGSIPSSIELAYSPIPSKKCDVYSFGVVALETIMGKHPGDHVSRECSSTQSKSPMLLKDVLDQRLLSSSFRLQNAQDVVSIAKLALACLQADPHLRPTMRQVSRELCTPVPLDVPLSAISLEQLRDLNVRKFGALMEDAEPASQ
ncbi:leucine-rich repeat receptor-like serine/threonine-protein kinase At1g17230 isoform X4 [Rhodamnia argentea]|uniref:Leucine-rich repeat receptor-like serine/threonine-protein kinase At1g17230 isoform X4 n=1 Tax=Rhodamnia argentea TaxID=178133 RepID=A0ABM3HRE6_9MYRT|nr:leucine-rich repeat receptor-like serine/threonine-protein kinase At1g17230 isoform X4 [Rhodamnia argentea]